MKDRDNQNRGGANSTAINHLNDDDYFNVSGRLSQDQNAENDHDSEHSSTEARDQVCHNKFQQFEEIKKKGIIDKN